MKIGFSTGSIALDDVARGVRISTTPRTSAIELSALREKELDPLLALVDGLQESLKAFTYVSIHAPSKRREISEADFISKLKPIADRGWAIIVHPDVIDDFALWKPLKQAVCIENMDKRKGVGQTTAQLKTIFQQLPDATFCFDIGHARQVDPTMQEASSMLRCFGDRLRQIHMSHVNSQSGHERLNSESINAFRTLGKWLDASVPVILETPVSEADVDDEISAAERVFARNSVGCGGTPPEFGRSVVASGQK